MYIETSIRTPAHLNNVPWKIIFLHRAMIGTDTSLKLIDQRGSVYPGAVSHLHMLTTMKTTF